MKSTFVLAVLLLPLFASASVELYGNATAGPNYIKLGPIVGGEGAGFKMPITPVALSSFNEHELGYEGILLQMGPGTHLPSLVLWSGDKVLRSDIRPNPGDNYLGDYRTNWLQDLDGDPYFTRLWTLDDFGNGPDSSYGGNYYWGSEYPDLIIDAIGVEVVDSSIYDAAVTNGVPFSEDDYLPFDTGHFNGLEANIQCLSFCGEPLAIPQVPEPSVVLPIIALAGTLRKSRRNLLHH